MFPQGPFNVIVADPPWLYQKNPGVKSGGEGVVGYAEREYPTMTNEDIAALPIRDLAAKDAHLFMWVTNPGLYGGRFSRMTPFEIAEDWGFTFKTMLTWVKTTKAGPPSAGGMGWYFRGATEHVLYATRGKAKIPSDRRESNVILAPKSRHSAKPDAFMELVERVTDGRRIELFARNTRPGWASWGNEIELEDAA
jgi:N6-adenosine-specific RNA methylase IME4